ncbi:MAG TPA: hypothetical protein VI461_16500, partial [Chitinophagaceae bacterium]|nr:hypothetical protein [Chitinophagaceae bacterium]
MKKNILFFLTLSLLIGFASCKKESSNNNNSDEMATHSDDQELVAAEVDAVANDADITLESTAGFSGRFTGVQGVICDGTVVVDTSGNPRTITITYDGSNC